jgi:hypothetical protein
MCGSELKHSTVTDQRCGPIGLRVMNLGLPTETSAADGERRRQNVRVRQYRHMRQGRRASDGLLPGSFAALSRLASRVLFVFPNLFPRL